MVQVHKDDLWVLLLSTIRYSMGRRSYITGLTADLARQFAKHLNQHNVDQIIREITQELTMYENMGKTLGDSCDHDIWKRLVEDLKKVEVQGK